MDVFQDYAYYYNLFYGDKDYRGEAATVDHLLKKYGTKEVRTLLNMGCGTGRHDSELVKLGYEVSGIDMSPQMLEIAKENNPDLSYEVADIREYESRKKFDAVTALFHVMSYQNTNEDFVKALKAASSALDIGGVFLFDVWYGPGVLTDRPSVRVKKVEDEQNLVIRYARPDMYADKNLVDVNYEVLVINKEDHRATKMEETHHMRYYFAPETEYLLEQNGFKLMACLDCNTLKETDYTSWTAYFVAQKVK